jgi:hypothetical protein
VEKFPIAAGGMRFAFPPYRYYRYLGTMSFVVPQARGRGCGYPIRPTISAEIIEGVVGAGGEPFVGQVETRKTAGRHVIRIHAGNTQLAGAEFIRGYHR